MTAFVLAGVAHWAERRALHRKAAGLIPVGEHMGGNQLMFLYHISVSLSVSFPSSLSMPSGED